MNCLNCQKEAGAPQMAEVFLPYAMHQDGKTMFALFDEQYAQRALTAGNAEKSA